MLQRAAVYETLETENSSKDKNFPLVSSKGCCSKQRQPRMEKLQRGLEMYLLQYE